MDVAEIITNVISSGAIITATYQIIKGLKTRLGSLETVVKEQRGYIEEIRNDFKHISSIKSNFIAEFRELHSAYKDHSEKTYKEIIFMKEEEISFLKKNKLPKKYYQKKISENREELQSSIEKFNSKEKQL
jgi:hypothetical protein